MHKEITCGWLADKCICALLILSMLSIVNMEIIGFPIYSLLLLVLASVWMVLKIIYAGRAGLSFLTIRYLTDTAAAAAFLYAVFSAVVKLFGAPKEGGIDFVWNAEVIALAIICQLISSEGIFKPLYMDLLLYSGLLVTGWYLLINLTDGWGNSRLAAAFTDSGQTASYFLLIGMVSVYSCCMCRDRLRSVFYLMLSGVSFFALFLNQNVISLWMMGIFFLAIPVLFCPTAMLVKRAMQLFCLYLFMLSNMSLLIKHTQIIRTEVVYPPEYGIYLELLLAAGGLFFFHYWERIPEGMDLERLVLRKMQKRYRFLLKALLLTLAVIVFGGDRWTGLPDGVTYHMIKSFASAFVEAVKKSESGFLCCFRTLGIIPGIFLIISVILFLDRMHKNYAVDKPVTASLILISGMFLAQLLFWNPGMHNIICYFYVLAAASYYKEERTQMESVGVKASDLELKIQEIQI